ncbi:MAG: hypothetical protein V4538_11510 [Bacteroidota bacterium]
MNRLKNQNNFEQKLKEQFDNFEAKPNEALWESIAQNLPEDKFEKSIASKLSSLETTPSQNVWLAIEKKLPLIATQMNKKLIYLWTGVVLTFGLIAGYFISQYTNNINNLTADLTHPEAFVWLNNKTSDANAQTITETTTTSSIHAPTRTTHENTLALAEKSHSGNRPNLSAQSHNNSTEIANTNVASVRENENLPTSNAIVSQGKHNVTNAATTATESNTIPQNNQNTIASTLGKTGALEGNNTANSNDEPIAKKETNNNDKTLSNNTPTISSENKGNSDILAQNKIDSTPVAEVLTNKVDTATESTQVKSMANNQASENDYTGPSLKKERLTILAYAGFAFGNMYYTAGNNQTNATANINLREKTERSASDINGGFLIGYDLNKRFTLSSGIILANFKQTLSYSVEAPKNNYPTKQGENFQHGADTITTGGSYTAELKYSYTEIPLFITYKVFENQKFEFALQSGLGLGIITGVNTYIISTDNIGIYEVNGKDDFPKVKNTLFFTFQPQIMYNLPANPGISIGFMPTVKASLSNIINDESWIKQYPYSFGLNAFIRKRF